MNNLVKLVLVGGLGYLAYKMFASSTDSTSETTPPTLPEPLAPTIPNKYEYEQEARTPIFEASKYAQVLNNRYREGSDMPPSEVAGIYNPLNIL